MKFTKLFFSVLAGAAMVACTSDDVLENVTPNEPTLGNDKAYVAIRLVNADAATRGGDGGFADGTADESYVKTAEFYFYDDANSVPSHYVPKALSWDNTPTGNVEEFAHATVVLEGLKNKTAPKYVVAVLNGEAAAYKNVTLENLNKELVDKYVTENAGFIMTNSTYNNANPGCFATVLTEDNFLLEEPKEYLDETNAVTIYVERVASKVTLAVSDAILNNGKIKIGEYEIDNSNTKEEIAIEVKGWALSGTTKTSYIEKHINTDWKFDWVWDAATNFRSYWAESTNYGNGVYPASYGQTITDKVNYKNAEVTLTYRSWDDVIALKKGNNSDDYCLENTNTVDVLTNAKGNFNSTVTHALLLAQVEGGDDLVRYDGQLFTETGFMNRVLNQINMNGKAFKGEDLTPLGAEHLEIVYLSDGHVTIRLKDEAATDWYADAEKTPLLVTEITKMINLIAVDAEYYKSGMMYYNIPIEHLGNGKFSIDVDGGITVEEGDYGVVRNHWYKLNISKIEHLGNAVYDPTEPIVPTDKTPTFYVGATINVLAWKVVNQSVEL